MVKRRTNRRNRRTMRGGMCPLAVQAMGGGLGVATQQALAQGTQFGGLTRSYHGGFRTGGSAYGVNVGTAYGVNQMGGKSRKMRNMRRKMSRRRMRGGMAPLAIFGGEGVDVNRASAHLTGQDNALNEAAAFSRTLAGTDNPGASTARMVGGRRGRKSQRRRRQRGGAVLNGEGAPAGASYMLLADDQALQRAAAQVENPAWAGVAKMQFV